MNQPVATDFLLPLIAARDAKVASPTLNPLFGCGAESRGDRPGNGVNPASGNRVVSKRTSCGFLVSKTGQRLSAYWSDCCK
jgi:hypothetical protein